MKEKRHLLVVRNTWATHRHSTFQEFKTVFESMGLTNKHVKIREHDLQMTFWNGSTIVYKGGDDEQKLLSISNISDIWCEESFELSRGLIEQLFLRVRRNDIKCHFFFSFNPISKANYMYEFIHDEKTLQDGFVHKSTYLDNSFLSKEYISQIEDLQRTNYLKYQVYALGEFGTLGKTIFTNWRVDPALDIENLYQQGLEVRKGIDFGYTNDACTFMTLLVDKANKKLYVVDELYEHGLLNEDLAKRVLQKDENNRYDTIYCDSAEPKSIAQLKNYGLKGVKPATKGQGSIMAGIDLLQTYEIIVASHCKHTAEEFVNYTFKQNKQTGEYINEPLSNGFDHCIDAIRYAMSPYLQGLNKARTMSKAVLGI